MILTLGAGALSAGAARFSQARAEATPPVVVMGFFVTSIGSGHGGDFGGIAGADRHCQALANAAGGGQRQWRAYLSTDGSDGRPAENARDRIGLGPWANARGQLIARNLEELHETARTLSQISLSERKDRNNIAAAYALDEHGNPLSPARRHAVLTGSRADGTAFAVGRGQTCRNWTSHAASDAVRLGHPDRTGGGQDPESWNSAETGSGCGETDLAAGGSDALLYCFARR
ncbi:lectin [Novosphingobium flavum]|uniref:Lectin n=1 Tax=Novosphingobium flavum TaxID=1778672 RepID=A0A7X1FU73_9SPHN|nr:lectin [Novosphingobium flavum]